ncbi:class I SAM-dependent methyltransferase [Ancylobacter oerskovii]|uniref:Methyltransferase domain-containing protein n=1 Tax=Ancylobacter oerskovii TaxID=459519 RepID=A0ABW4YUC3_9HYPH|nr:class I SAM-dependent methyltransferase [Ancylobacter oerskovii]MBS7543668.1 methyltransferase domain-containing protein [Ancylobacter oerskovii]
MYPDVVDLRSFYAQPLGVVARRLVGRAVRARFDNVRGLSVLGIGYATPYLGVFREECERALAFMPAAQGVTRWPSRAPTLAALVDESELPLPNGAIDRVVAVHLIEHASDATEVLREVWRVLAPGGRLLCVVPNRRGVWARVDNNPFGHGRPYSRSQVTALLREALFTPVGWGEALYVPPVPRTWFLRSAVAWERVGGLIASPFAGVHIVEATKQLYRPVAVKRRARMRVLAPVLAPQPAGG